MQQQSVPPPLRSKTVALLIGWGTLSIVVHGAAAPFLLGTVGASLGQIAVRAAFWAGLGVAMSALLTLPLRRIFADPTPTVGRVLALVGLCTAGGLLFAEVFYATIWPLPEAPAPSRPGRSSWPRAISPALSLLAYAALDLVRQNVRRWQEARERQLAAEASAVEARLAMLRYELAPHFLFNTLNAIVGTIDESPPRAQQMVRQLAELLRHTLDRSDRLVPFGDEVRTIELYLAIEQVRFEERLQVEIEVAPEAAARHVPPLLLQPLVENAIQHGMTAAPMRLRLRAWVDEDRLRVEVANTGHLGPPRSDGVGLRNLRDRLEHAYVGARFDLDRRGDEVVAALDLPAAR